jgi:glucokinase
MDVLAGMDFGGTSVKIGLVLKNGTLLSHGLIAIDPCADFESIMTAVARSLDSFLNAMPPGGKLVGIGIGTPGFTDEESGVLLEGCRNIPSLQGNSVRRYIADRFGVPTVTDNDATCAASGELLFGAGRKYSNFVLLTIGTGIGGGLVLDGKVFRGARGYAAEIGHMCIDPNGPWCICGSRGCLEQFASGTAIQAAYNQKAAKRGLEAAPSAESVADRARQGDVLAVITMREAATRIAQAFGTILNLLDLQACIVGGGVSRAGDILLGPIRAELPDYCWPLVSRSVDICAAGLSNNAGVVGAAAHMMSRLST